MNNAPIAITVYDRLHHFDHTIRSLLLNDLASSTDLYVAIDAPYRDSDIDVNLEIINYSKNISGFKSVNLFIRDKNYGALRNAEELIAKIFETHDSIIITEDDNEFSPFFLNYMNDGLLKYRDTPEIFAVCSYLEPLKIDECLSVNTFTRTGFTSYGYATWKNRFSNVDLKAQDFLSKYRDVRKFSDFGKKFGIHISAGLLYAAVNKKIFGDYSICHYMQQNNQRCIFPIKSLVRNIGQDGSGLHSGLNQALLLQAIWDLNEPIIHTLDDKVDALMAKYLLTYHERSIFYKYAKYFQYLYYSIMEGFR
jgi:hypothetical protein